MQVSVPENGTMKTVQWLKGARRTEITYFNANLGFLFNNTSHLTDLRTGKGLDEGAWDQLRERNGQVAEVRGRRIDPAGPKRPFIKIMESLQMGGAGVLRREGLIDVSYYPLLHLLFMIISVGRRCYLRA